MAYTTIDDPSAHFQTKLYTGTGSATSFTNDGNSDLQPDLVWIKQRNGQASDHVLTNSNIGSGNFLASNTADGNIINAQMVTSFDTDGFSLGTNALVNQSGGYLYVAWQWLANGGTTSSNTSGTITSTVQANTDAGFSICSYGGNGDPYGQTFGHGLGAAPKMVVVKRSSGTQSWAVYHVGAGATNYLRLNGTNASTASSAHWFNTAPTSTLVTIGGNGEVNASSENYIAYCFAEKQGYSKFGVYTGNSNSNGPFVYTGFKPAFLLIKSLSSSTHNWFIFDSKRGFNGSIEYGARPNSDVATTAAGDDFDLYSNGFKSRTAYAHWNTATHEYMYAAFAENPFVSSTGIPTTAR